MSTRGQPRARRAVQRAEHHASFASATVRGRAADPTDEPLQLALEVAILQRLQQARNQRRTRTLAGLVKEFRSGYSAADVRRAVTALIHGEFAKARAWNGDTLVELWEVDA